MIRHHPYLISGFLLMAVLAVIAITGGMEWFIDLIHHWLGVWHSHH